MFSENIVVRIFFLIIAILVMLGIFGLIVRRGSIILGFELNIRRILLFSIGLIVLFLIGMTVGNLSWRGAEIFGAVLVWIIYALRVMIPLLIIIDIIGIWYKAPAIGILVVSLMWIGFGLYQGINIKTTSITLSNTKILEQKKFIFISDLHVETIRNRRYVQSIVDKIKKINPDFVLIGGDLMNSAKSDYVNAFLPFNQLEIPIFATLGNHDHMGDSTAVSKIFETTKIILLRNKSIEISGLQIVGIDDKSYRSGKNIRGILEESDINDNGEFTILMSHQPQNLKKLEGFPIDLELAGHTHNGQFIPFSWIVGLFNDYTYGTYKNGNKTAFVSQGIGSWGTPIRIGTKSELVVVSLEVKAK